MCDSHTWLEVCRCMQRPSPPSPVSRKGVDVADAGERDTRPPLHWTVWFGVACTIHYESLLVLLLITEGLITPARFLHHPSASPAVTMWKVVGQHLFLNIIPNDFIARTGWKVCCDRVLSRWRKSTETYCIFYSFYLTSIYVKNSTEYVVKLVVGSSEVCMFRLIASL